MDTIIIGVSSGIAAYKSLELVSGLREAGFDVIVMMTENAKRMLSQDEFEVASGNRVASELFSTDFNYKDVLNRREVEHVSLAQKAKIICIAPATANIIAKIANGIADDLLTTTILASKAPLLLCPSMNINMWQNEITQENLKRLVRRGALYLEPEEGMLACGTIGKGRLPDVNVIKDEIIKLINKGNQFKDKRVIITAGGTEEEIDGVRVITNRSSGKMGICLAGEFVRRGAKVKLISARCDVEPMVQLEEIRVKSASEMKEAIKAHVHESDIIVHAAAVSDFKVKTRVEGKICSNQHMSLELVPTEKILDLIKRWNDNLFLVGFKAEVNVSDDQLRESALGLAKRSKANMIIANDVKRRDVFGSDENEVIIVHRGGQFKKVNKMSKKCIAGYIIDEIHTNFLSLSLAF
ncbi:MAG: bifunctional phosphopantothenoylcysteine decarboxylase/phosphopantothenate--cysteine ligase CoaBC [Pseudomonadota bacterium]